MNDRQQAIMDSIPDKEQKIVEMFRLLLECRDAIPAIKMTAAKLRGIDLTLADRIEDCIEPWAITEDKD